MAIKKQDTPSTPKKSNNEIYASAYEQDSEFFRFQRALIACEEALSARTRIIVGPESLGLCDNFIDQARRNGQRQR